MPTNDTMMNQILDFCEKEHMLCEQDYVVAGVSGGADSVCLLFVLLELKKKIHFDLHVVHVNHKIRKEAGEDAEYVRELCSRYHVLFSLVECEVEQYAKKHHMSTEEAGREVRYQAFYDVLLKNKKQKSAKIAIAHNQNDCAETVLFHLFRGSGLKGLSGISAVTKSPYGTIIRPLLMTSREEIEAYLSQRGISFCVDRTNLSDDYSRNRIRHHVLPLANEEVAQATRHIREAAIKIEEANRFIEDMTREKYDICVTKMQDAFVISVEQFEKLHPTLKPYLCKSVLEQAAGRAKDIGSIHVEKIMELFSMQVGRSISLPYGLCARRIYEGVRIQNEVRQNVDEWEYPLSNEEKLSLECGKELEITVPNGDKVRLVLIPALEQQLKNIPTFPYTKWIDYDKIKGNVVIRNRRIADYFVLNEKGQRKSLKTYFVDQKIPSDCRDRTVLVADDEHVLWIVPDRLSYDCRITCQTQRILEINYLQG